MGYCRVSLTGQNSVTWKNAGDAHMTSNTILRPVLMTLCVAALCETTSRTLQADEPKGELAGVVVDLNGRPVANAKVWLETRPPANIASTTTSVDGRFH